jgi:NTE family protein
MTKKRLATATVPPNSTALPTRHCILVLQGGGALGAYQAGVYEALCTAYREITWVAGISIGAINAALIAGNPPELRVQRLREFWEHVTSSMPVMFGNAIQHPRETVNDLSAAQGMLLGVPGFFRPRIPPAPLQPRGTLAAISYYDTKPLRETLDRLVDFDRINSGPTRLSLGAVNVRNGNFKYFDSANMALDARHVMASGALPPGFPPVEIDGEHYWDGGLVSNTPLQYVLDQPSPDHRTIFQVDLFAASGALPATLAEVADREKDIRFSSRTRLNTTNALERHVSTQAVQRLLDKLPAELREDPAALALARLSNPGGVDIVHLIYRSKHDEIHAKDYEFSRRSMQEHWQAGLSDMSRTLRDARWTAHSPKPGEVHVFDLVDVAAEPKRHST